MKAIYKRELKSLFNGMIAYIVMALILVVVGFVSSMYNFTQGVPYFEYIFLDGFVVIANIIAIALLTMRSFSEEKHERTDQLLYSLPLNMSSIVMGKFFALLTVYLIPNLIMMIYPLVVSTLGGINMTQTYSMILLQFVLGAALIPIGMFLSSLTETQVISAVGTIAVFFGIYFMPTLASTFLPETARASFICYVILIALVALVVYSLVKNIQVACITAVVLEGANLLLFIFKPDLYTASFPELLSKLSMFNRYFDCFEMTGTNLYATFDLGCVVYYLSILCVFLFLTVQSLEKKRYN